jgi:hypothetical protein
MGLAPYIPANDPRHYAESLQRELYERNRQLADTEEELRQERQKTAAVEQGVGELRKVLKPLYNALQHVFGVTEGIGPIETSAASPRASAVWESWKQKLSGTAGKAIDALLLHGTMTAEQLRIHLGCATRTCYNIIGELNRAKLIDKNGGKISLKSL